MDEYDLEQLERLRQDMEQYWKDHPWEELEPEFEYLQKTMEAFFGNELSNEHV